MSNLQEEIKKAIGAHGLWKTHLKAAVDTGSSEFTPDKVAVDNLCAFGKWLYGPTISASQKDAHYEECRKLHAEFHKITAGVLQQALSGHKDKAHQEVNDQMSPFSTISVKLTQAMMKWMKSAV